MGRLELPRAYAQQILSLVCLPIPPHSQKSYLTITVSTLSNLLHSFIRLIISVTDEHLRTTLEPSDPLMNTFLLYRSTVILSSTCSFESTMILKRLHCYYTGFLGSCQSTNSLNKLHLNFSSFNLFSSESTISDNKLSYSYNKLRCIMFLI